MSFLFELLEYMKVRKKFWLAPIFFIMLLLGMLIVLAVLIVGLAPGLRDIGRLTLDV